MLKSIAKLLIALVLVTTSAATSADYLGQPQYQFTTPADNLIAAANMTRPPVYFFSHGGPTLIEMTTHPAYHSLQSIGREITQVVKPKAVIVISAHWQSRPHSVEVNTSEREPLIYDFGGFPSHFYKLQFPVPGSPSLANSIIARLREAGVEAQPTKRGLDHGVFVPFLVAFDPKTNPLTVPLVQLSLFDSDSAEQHIALGRALRSLRDEGVCIIASGMAVHNLRDYMYGRSGVGYGTTFLKALGDVVEGEVDGRDERMAELLKRPDARQAHPSFEHLLPVHVAVGAAGDDKGRTLMALPEGPLSWAQYRFGDV